MGRERAEGREGPARCLGGSAPYQPAWHDELDGRARSGAAHEQARRHALLWHARPLAELFGALTGTLLTAAENAPALAALSGVLHDTVTRFGHRDAVCTAYVLTAGDAAAWGAFVASVQGAPLGPGAAEALADPAACA